MNVRLDRGVLRAAYLLAGLLACDAGTVGSDAGVATAGAPDAPPTADTDGGGTDGGRRADAAGPDSAWSPADAVGPDGASRPADATGVPSDADATAAPGWREAAVAVAAAMEGPPLIDTVTALADPAFGGRDNLTPGGQAARAWLVERLTALGVEPFGTEGFEQPFPAGVNVVGRIPGTSSDEVVVVSAHYDHLGTVGAPESQCHPDGSGDPVCHGAADNASGCAVLLGVADALLRLPQPRRTVVLVLFDAEEDGLLGSAWWVDAEPLVPLARTVAAVNVDTVGTTIIPGATSSFALGAEYAPGFTGPVTSAAQDAGLVVYPVSSFFDGSDDGERSDHYSFRRVGVPSLFLSSGAPPEYHSPSDVPSVVVADKLLRTTRHTLLLVGSLAFEDAAPALLQTPEPHIGDAVALADLGDLVLADPEAAGVTDPLEVQFLTTIVARLHQYVETPPLTAAEWAEYDDFIRGVLDTVYATVGR